MATTLGWLLGGFILSGQTILISGFLVGFFQWLVLPGRISHPWRWIVFTISGWTVGYLITLFMVSREFELVNGTVI
jgi:hypothetical protein